MIALGFNPSWIFRGPFVAPSWTFCGPVVAPSWPRCGFVVAPSWTWPSSPQSRTIHALGAPERLGVPDLLDAAVRSLILSWWTKR